MKQENNFDEIDELLFKAYKKAPKIPDSTKYTIHNAFNIPRKQKKKVYVYRTLQKVAIFIISFTILTTGVVFAKDIINFITNLFTNSTKAIDTAVENGYVQNVEMDFVIDKDIGIKVNQLTMDNRNLDIAFEYYSDLENISNLEIGDYIIKDEQDNIIYYNLENNNQINQSKAISSSCRRTNDIIAENNNYYESFLITIDNTMPKSKTVIIEIKSFIAKNTTSNEKSIITGNWNFSISLDDDIVNNTTENYSFSDNEYISNIFATLDETSLSINIELNTDFDEIVLANINSTIIKDSIGKQYTCIAKRSYTQNNINYIDLKFDISKYYENIDTLNLYIKLDKDKSINIDLSK